MECAHEIAAPSISQAHYLLQLGSPQKGCQKCGHQAYRGAKGELKQQAGLCVTVTLKYFWHRVESDCWAVGFSPRLRAQSHVSLHLLSRHHLHRNQGKMGLRELLRLPKNRHRKQSKAKSEVDPIEGPSKADPAAPRLTESTPDLHIGASTSLTCDPLTTHNQESNSMELVSS